MLLLIARDTEAHGHAHGSEHRVLEARGSLWLLLASRSDVALMGRWDVLWCTNTHDGWLAGVRTVEKLWNQVVSL